MLLQQKVDHNPHRRLLMRGQKVLLPMGSRWPGARTNSHGDFSVNPPIMTHAADGMSYRRVVQLVAHLQMLLLRLSEKSNE